MYKDIFIDVENKEVREVTNPQECNQLLSKIVSSDCQLLKVDFGKSQDILMNRDAIKENVRNGFYIGREYQGRKNVIWGSCLLIQKTEERHEDYMTAEEIRQDIMFVTTDKTPLQIIYEKYKKDIDKLL